MKKKVGIITMHKVLNSGSLLQAYALQTKIEQLGYDAEIINYDFPYRQFSYTQRFRNWWHEFLKLFLKPKQYDVLFHWFRIKYQKTTRRTYTPEQLVKNPPRYDIYMSGSDQIWNPRWTNGDLNFMLAFAPQDAIRVAYASSFTQKSIPAEYHKQYAYELNKFSYITVREDSGKQIVKDLIGKDIQCVCDPTLLLYPIDYKHIAEQSMIKTDEPYILVYVLNYMYNPFPEVNKVIDKVRKVLKCKAFYIYCDNPYPDNPDCIQLPEKGVSEFVWLLSHAKFVITSSFHGTAFSLINHIPLFAIVQNMNPSDDRITSLLKAVNQDASIIPYNSDVDESLITSSRIISTEENLKPIREQSSNCLMQMLQL